jgi:hypothetical protein
VVTCTYDVANQNDVQLFFTWVAKPLAVITVNDVDAYIACRGLGHVSESHPILCIACTLITGHRAIIHSRIPQRRIHTLVPQQRLHRQHRGPGVEQYRRKRSAQLVGRHPNATARPKVRNRLLQKVGLNGRWQIVEI